MIFVAVAVAALGSACTPRMTPGTVRTGDADNPFVSIEAGNIETGRGTLFARYVVDRATQTCWLMAYSTSVRLHCCEARRVPAVARFVTWEDEASCARASGSAPSAQTSGFGGH